MDREAIHEISMPMPPKEFRVIFAGEFLRRYGLGSASNVQRAVDGLSEWGIIDQDNGSFLIADRFFRLWIQTAQII